MTAITPLVLRRTIWLIATIGTLLSLLAFNALKAQLEHHSRLEFQWLAKDRVGALQRGMEDTIQFMDLMSRLLTVDQDQTRCIRQSRSIFASVPGLHALLYLPDPEFASQSVWHVCPDPDQPPLLSRLTDFPLNPTLTALTDKATQVHGSVVTVTQTVSGPSSAPGKKILMILTPHKPFREQTDAGTELATGFLIGLFDLDELIQQSIRLLEPRGVQILILEQNEHEQMRFIDSYASRLDTQPDDPVDSSHWQEWLNRQRLMIQETVVIADKRWMITAVPSKHLLSGEEFPNTPWLILIAGLVITTLLTIFLLHIEFSINVKHRLYTELKQSEIKLRILFHQYPDTILTVDRRGMVLLANRPDMRHLTDLLGPENPPEISSWHLHTLRKVFTTGEMDQFQYPDSEFQWREVRFVPIRTDGRIVEVMVLSTDITEKYRQQEQAVRHARLASLGVLAAGMAHEINNPNNTIQFNLGAWNRAWPDIAAVLRHHHQEHGEYIVGGVLVERALEMLPALLESMQGNARRITEIVKNLKHMSRPDPGLSFQAVNMHKIIRNVVSIIQHPVKKHTDAFEVHIPEEMPELYGNPLQLEQLLLNLLLNALESLPDRRAKVMLDCTLAEDGKWLIVRVVDEGVGMTEPQMAHMFTPFFTTKEEQGGIGMGLSIVWDIVKRHGGSIQVDSRFGHGTVMTVTLPLPDKTANRT